MSNSITVSTNSGPVVVQCYDFSKFTEVNRFHSTQIEIMRALYQVNAPNSPEVKLLIEYGNRMIAECNSRYPSHTPVPYFSIVTTSVHVTVVQTKEIPGAVVSGVQNFTHHETKSTTIATQQSEYQNLSELTRGMSEEDQLRLMMEMEASAASLTLAAGGFEEKSHSLSPADSAMGFRTTKQFAHGCSWSVTRYTDGTSCVNGTFIHDGPEPIDPTGGVHGEAPYCFLIALWHDNPDFMARKGYKSPSALLNTLKRAGKIIAPNRMFERDSIVPVAQFLKAAVLVEILDRHDAQFDDGIIGDDQSDDYLTVRLVSLRQRHYISGTE